MSAKSVSMAACIVANSRTVAPKMAIPIAAKLPPYGDGKVANREIRVWHGATENGP
jgi:hypothetical protein